ncbi:MAG: sigma-E processing peptidase SpoIIGA [Oscillospiraceae bacterium]|nr:sigma-E processing peptidase SpoIIGA [Oscillospiraceae bacterium]
MRVIYIDTLFVLNLIVNYLLLLATAKIAAVHISRWRIGLGALFGAGYAVAAFFPAFGFLLAAPMRLVSGGLMVLITFGNKRRILRLVLLFFAVSAAFGGLIFAIGLMVGGAAYDGQFILPLSVKVLVAAFGVCYGLFSLLFARLGRDTGGGLVQVELTHHGRTATVTGLIDTGNSLADPVSGGPVFVVETEALAPLFHRDTIALLTDPTASPVELLPQLRHTPDTTGFYLIPYTAVGTKGGFLLTFRPDAVRINGQEKRSVSVSLSPTCVSDGGRYTALVNGGI